MGNDRSPEIQHAKQVKYVFFFSIISLWEKQFDARGM